MNPDPSDRLVDSLLKEQSRGKADEDLLQSIEEKFDATGVSVRRRPHSAKLLWLAAAAALVLGCFGTLAWQASKAADAKAEKLEADRAAVRATLEPPAGVVVGNAEGGLTQLDDPRLRSTSAFSVGNDPVDAVITGGSEPETSERAKPRADEADLIGGAGGFVLPGEESASHEDLLPRPPRQRVLPPHPMDRKVATADAVAWLDGLRFVREESVIWYVEFGIESGGKWAPRFTGLSPDKKRLTNKVSASSMLAPGDTFFQDGAMAGRFKFIGFADKEILNERIGAMQAVRTALYEDLKPGKEGRRYESRHNLPDSELLENAYHDRTAVLSLALAGHEGKEFKVEEGTAFALPPNAAEKNYLLKAVARQAIVVEYSSPFGDRLTQEITREASR